MEESFTRPAPLTDKAFLVLDRLVEEYRQGGHERLPTERELALMLGISRSTLRAAVARLEASGRVTRKVGRAGGIFVTDPCQTEVDIFDLDFSGRAPRVRRSLNTTKGVPQLLGEQGFDPGTTILSARRAPAPPGVRKALGLPEGTEVTVLDRVRHADAAALSLERMYLRAPADLRHAHLETVYASLRDEFGIVVSRTDEQIDVIEAPRSVSRHLGHMRGEGLLRIQRVAYDQHGNPVECSIDLFRADRTRVVGQAELA